MNLDFLNQFKQETVFKTFYISGTVIFLIVGIANTFTNFHNWEFFILSAKVSAVFMNIFNYFIATFFFMLFKGLSKKPDPIVHKDLDEIFKEARKSEKK